MEAKTKKQMKLTSAQIIPLGFLGVIAVGTLLLLLPFSTAAGEHTSFLTALFTSATSVCVTGLVVVDTYSHWSLFGKIVILLLIQLGGLGIVAVSSSFLLLFKKKIFLKDRVLLRDSFNLDSTQGLLKFLLRVIKGVFAVEGIGAILYAFAFIPKFGLAKGVWFSVFHSISAFCNAGIDILGPDSLVPFAHEPWVLIVTMLLIIVGGLGYFVWFDLSTSVMHLKKNASRENKRLAEHSMTVLLLTAFLILFGAVLVFLFENRNPATIASFSFGEKVLHSLFQSVTFRTAGFCAVPQSNLTEASSLLGCIWMFIGGSPMGTAGGVKTVTVFIIVLNAVSYIRNRKETLLFGRHVSSELVQKSTAIVSFSLMVTVVMVFGLLISDRLPLVDTLYEMFSATGTVGLSRGVTQILSPAGRILVIIAMYLGRIGPISIALFFGQDDQRKNYVRHADGQFYVG